MRFGHTRLNSTLYKMSKHDTGRCEFCGQEESVEHVILYYQKYETERRILMQNVEKIQMRFKEVYYKITREMNAIVLFFSTLKLHICGRELKKKKKRGKVVSHFDPHSIPVGGRNTQLCCLSTTNTFQEEEDNLQRPTISRVYREWSGKEKLSSERQLCGRKCLVDVRGQRRMGRLVRDDRKATVTQITTRYNQCMQNTISERTTCRTLK